MQSTASTSTAHNTTNNNSNSEIHDALSRDFPQVARLSREDLILLLDDPTYFSSYSSTLPHSTTLLDSLENALMKNIELAKKNEGMREGLEELRRDTEGFCNGAEELRRRWGEVERSMEGGYKRFKPPIQLSRLSRATALQESLSEQLIQSFLDGQMDEITFSRQFVEVRKLFHRRELMKDKWEKGGVVWRM